MEAVFSQFDRHGSGVIDPLEVGDFNSRVSLLAEFFQQFSERERAGARCLVLSSAAESKQFRRYRSSSRILS